MPKIDHEKYILVASSEFQLFKKKKVKKKEKKPLIKFKDNE